MIAAIVTLAERPDLTGAMWSMPYPYAAFIEHDPVCNFFFARLPGAFAEHQLLALDEHDAIVGKVNSVPFAWAGIDDDLPARGVDAILERAFSGRERGVPATAVSLLEARLAPAHRGQGVSYRLLEAARRNALRLGLNDLFGPVRPAAKSEEPGTPMAEYAARVRGDGLPVDGWLRAHVRLGARIVKVCPLSLIVPGTLAQWREWSGLELARSGSYDVAGALSPVQVSLEHDHGVYVEPNVWVHHRLTTT